VGISTYRLSLNNAPVTDEVLNLMWPIEVEESVDLPGAIRFSLPVDSDGNNDLTFVNDAAFQPFVSVSIVVTAEDRVNQCIFDGLILSSKLHLKKGSSGSTLQVWGQDVSWLMNLQEITKEWPGDSTDGSVANQIFQKYNITPDSGNLNDASPAHNEDGRTLMQRASDIQFLRSLARRNGKLCRVACAGTPGVRTGFFGKPSVEGSPVATLNLNDPDAWNVDEIDVDWDVSRPTKVVASQALLTSDDPDGVKASVTDSGLQALAERNLAAFAGAKNSMCVMLTTTVDQLDELNLRSQSVLREANWFVRCEGVSDASRLNAVLRAGTVVLLNGAGVLNSGKYFVWSIRHTIDKQSHKMKFLLVRNAVGPARNSSASSLQGALP
jgi:phage protein D